MKKRIGILLVLLMLTTGYVSAEGMMRGECKGKGLRMGMHGRGCDCKMCGEKKEEMRKQKLGMLKEELNLNDKQTEKVDKIMKNGWEKMKAKKEAFKVEMKNLREEKDTQILEVLNKKQKKKFIKHKEEKKKKREESMKEMMDLKGEMKEMKGKMKGMKKKHRKMKGKMY